jgi:hypothetical protein
MLMHLLQASFWLSVLGVCCAFGPFRVGTGSGILPRIGKSSQLAVAYSAYMIASISYLSSLLVFAIAHGWFVEHFQITSDRYSANALGWIAASAILVPAAAMFCWIWRIGVRKNSPWLARKPKT